MAWQSPAGPGSGLGNGNGNGTGSGASASAGGMDGNTAAGGGGGVVVGLWVQNIRYRVGLHLCKAVILSMTDAFLQVSCASCRWSGSPMNGPGMRGISSVRR